MLETDDIENLYEDNFYYESSTQLLGSCVFGTFNSLQHNLLLTFGLTIVQRIVVSIVLLPLAIRNVLVALLGVVLLFSWEEIPDGVPNIFVLFSLSFAFLATRSFPHTQTFGILTTTVCCLILISLEFLLPGEDFTYRGMLMIFTMKISCLSFDLGQHKYTVEMTEVLGYLLNPATLLFGPALPLPFYRDSFKTPSIYSALTSSLQSFAYLILSLIFVSVSSCSSLFFPDTGVLHNYADAQSFRFSHFFICYWSQALTVLSGISSPLIVDVLRIEFPRSLTEVVVVWNVPMHKYLYNYVYRRLRSLGSAIAVLATFVVSSLLHGFNGQLSAVLLSLGILSYTEHCLRSTLSNSLSACVSSRPCSSCSHSHSSSSLLSRCINIVFLILSLYNLLYLGMPWNGEGAYTLSHALSVWKSHYFASHFIALLYFIIHKSMSYSIFSCLALP